MAKLGIIAGEGSLPGEIIDACRESGRDFYVLAFEGSADAAVLGDAPVEWIRMSEISGALAAARREGVEELVLVGRIPRPSPLALLRDARSAKFIAKVGKRILGDDNLLTAVVKELEETEGFRIIAPDALLGDLLAPEGVLTRREPSADEKADIERGIAVVRALGEFDIGQGAIVQNGTVLGVEGVEGTDALIARCGPFVQRDLPGGVLVKMPKPGQERRTDLPAIGRSTVENAAAAGLRGIAIEAGGALIASRSETIAAADTAGLFIVGFSG